MPASAKKILRSLLLLLLVMEENGPEKGEIQKLVGWLFRIGIFLFRILKRRASQRWRAKGSERGTMGINTISIAEATLIRCLGPARSNT